MLQAQKLEKVPRQRLQVQRLQPADYRCPARLSSLFFFFSFCTLSVGICFSTASYQELLPFSFSSR